MNKVADITLKALCAAAGVLLLFILVPKDERATFAPDKVPDQTETAATSSAVRMLFVGDMMFDRTIRSIGDSNGYGSLFSCLGEYMRGFDLVVGNLEGPITAYPSKSAGTMPGDPGNTSFTFSSAIVPVLASSGIRIIHAGNNHIMDFGREGADATAEFLSSGGIGHFGIPGYPSAITTSMRGVRIALVSYNQFLGLSDPQGTIDSIRSLREANDFVAVFAHWGDEYVSESIRQKDLARRFAEAGADLVIGSHPHVIQGRESWGGSAIYYSLGNFIFDQYWNEDVRTGLGVEATIDSRGVSYADTLFSLTRDGSTCLKTSVDNL